MPSLPRTVLLLGALFASTSLAQASGKAANETFPMLGTLEPKPAAAAPQTAETPAAHAEAKPLAVAVVSRQGRHGRRSRYAHAGRGRRLAAEERSRGTAGPAPAAPVAPAQTSPAQTSPAQAAAAQAAPALPAGTRGTLAPGEEQAAATPAQARAAEPADAQHERGAPTLADLVAKHAHENGVPVELAQAVIRIESRGNAHAAHGGALGLMQIKPGTARAAGFSGGASGLFVAETNLHYGMKILGQAYRSAGGDVCRALMQYQSGHLATRMTRANRAYCSRARAVMAGA